MTEKHKKMRLDQILVESGLVTDDQIKKALKQQKEFGGKLGSHLVSLGFVDENELADALSEQFEVKGVVLEELEIPDIIVKFIPSRIALARWVMPYDYNPDKNILMVACSNPDDTHLIDELNFVARGKKVELSIASEQSLKKVIEHYYGVKMKTLAGLPVSNADDETENDTAGDTKSIKSETENNSAGSLLIVGGNNEELAALKAMYELSSWQVETVSSGVRVPVYLESAHFNKIIIKESKPGRLQKLRQLLLAKSPDTVIITYKNTTDLFEADNGVSEQTELLIENLELFVLMISSKDKLKTNQSAQVGQYTNRLCQRLSLSEPERAVITSAGYLHDLARYYYNSSNTAESSDDISDLTCKLLESLNYSNEVIALLQASHAVDTKDSEEITTSINDIDASLMIGCSIIAAVTDMSRMIQLSEQLTTDKFELLRVHLAKLAGQKYLPEVATALIAMVEEEMLSAQADGRGGHVLILEREEADNQPIFERLRTEGFLPVTEIRTNDFVTLYQRCEPNMIILIDPVESKDLEKLMSELETNGIEIASIPTFIIADVTSETNLSALLDMGIEDIVSHTDNLNMLVAKMNRIRSRIIEQSDNTDDEIEPHPENRTMGRVADMNVIELLQMLGSARKTAMLSVKSPTGTLDLHLKHGEIIHAKAGDIGGASVIYEGITWLTGSWTIDFIDEAQLPEQNVFDSYEVLLLEGCRLLDESRRNNMPE